MNTEAEIRQLLRRWIVDHARRDVLGQAFDDTTPILASGLLSSLEIAELVLYLEHLLGAEIALADLEADVFHSIDTLWQRLFAKAHAQRAGPRDRDRAPGDSTDPQPCESRTE